MATAAWWTTAAFPNATARPEDAHASWRGRRSWWSSGRPRTAEAIDAESTAVDHCAEVAREPTATTASDEHSEVQSLPDGSLHQAATAAPTESARTGWPRRSRRCWWSRSRCRECEQRSANHGATAATTARKPSATATTTTRTAANDGPASAGSANGPGSTAADAANATATLPHPTATTTTPRRAELRCRQRGVPAASTSLQCETDGAGGAPSAVQPQHDAPPGWHDGTRRRTPDLCQHGRSADAGQRPQSPAKFGEIPPARSSTEDGNNGRRHAEPEGGTNAITPAPRFNGG